MVLNQQVAHDEKEGVVTHMYTCRVLAKSRTVAVVVFADGTHQLFFLDPDANVPPAVRTSDPIRLVDSAVFEQLQACVLSKLPEIARKFHEEQSRVAKEQDPRKRKSSTDPDVSQPGSAKTVRRGRRRSKAKPSKTNDDVEEYDVEEDDLPQ